MPASPITVRGVAMQPAVFSVTHQEPHQGVLEVFVRLDCGMPVRVVQQVGTEPSAHIAASSKARAIQRGAQVEATGAGLLPQSDHGIACLRLLGVSDVLIQPPTHTEVNHGSH